MKKQEGKPIDSVDRTHIMFVPMGKQITPIALQGLGGLALVNEFKGKRPDGTTDWYTEIEYQLGDETQLVVTLVRVMDLIYNLSPKAFRMAHRQFVSEFGEALGGGLYVFKKDGVEFGFKEKEESK